MFKIFFFDLKYKCFVTQVVNFFQKCFCMFTFSLRVLHTDTLWCQTISSIVNTKYLCQTRSVLSIFYMTQKNLYCLFKTFRIVPPKMVDISNSNVKSCPKFKVDLLHFGSVEEWALQIDENLRKNQGSGEREKEAAGAIPYLSSVLPTFLCCVS